MPDRPSFPRPIPLSPSKNLNDPRDSKYYDSLRRVNSTPLKLLPNRRHPRFDLHASAKSLKRTELPRAAPKHYSSSSFLFIRNLNDNVTTDFLQKALEHQGVLNIRHVSIPVIHGRRQGIACIHISSTVDPRAVAGKVDGLPMLGQKISVVEDPQANLYKEAWARRQNSSQSQPQSERRSEQLAPSQQHHSQLETSRRNSFPQPRPHRISSPEARSQRSPSLKLRPQRSSLHPPPIHRSSVQSTPSQRTTLRPAPSHRNSFPPTSPPRQYLASRPERREARQKQSPPKRTRYSQDPDNTGPWLYVGNLPPNTSKQELLHHFRDYRPVNVLDRTLTSRWIVFENERDRGYAYKRVRRDFGRQFLNISLAASKPPADRVPSVASRPNGYRTSSYAPKVDFSRRVEYGTRGSVRSGPYLPPRSNSSSWTDRQYRPVIEQRAKYSRPAPVPRRDAPKESTWFNTPSREHRVFKSDERIPLEKDTRSDRFEPRQRQASPAIERKKVELKERHGPENGKTVQYEQQPKQKSNTFGEKQTKELCSSTPPKQLSVSEGKYTEDQLHEATYRKLVLRIVEQISTRRMLNLEATLTNTLSDFLRKVEDAERRKEETPKSADRSVSRHPITEPSAASRDGTKVPTEDDAKSDPFLSDRKKSSSITPAHSDLYQFLFESMPSVTRRTSSSIQRKRNRVPTPASADESESTVAIDTDKTSQEISADSERPKKRIRKSRFSDAAGFMQVRQDDQEKTKFDLQRDTISVEHKANESVHTSSKETNQIAKSDGARDVSNHEDVAEREEKDQQTNVAEREEKDQQTDVPEGIEKDQQIADSRVEIGCSVEEDKRKESTSDSNKKESETATDGADKPDLCATEPEKDTNLDCKKINGSEEQRQAQDPAQSEEHEKSSSGDQGDGIDNSEDKDTILDESSVENKEETLVVLAAHEKGVDQKQVAIRDASPDKLRDETIENKDHVLSSSEERKTCDHQPKQVEGECSNEDNRRDESEEAEKKSEQAKGPPRAGKQKTAKEQKDRNAGGPSKSTESDELDGNKFVTLADLGLGTRLLRSHMKEIMRGAAPEPGLNQEKANRSTSKKTQVSDESGPGNAVVVASKRKMTESPDGDFLDIPRGGKGKKRKVGRRCAGSATPEPSETAGDDTSCDLKDGDSVSKESSGLEEIEIDVRKPRVRKPRGPQLEDDGAESARTKGFDLSEWRSRKSERPRTYVRQAVNVVSSSRDNRQSSRMLRKGISMFNPKHDILTMNSLRQRKKAVQYRKSEIHGMGLFACERIEPQEFILEYIGQIVRNVVADMREAAYTRRGMGDSYLFRLPDGMVVDATHWGGIARFINHSCDPNVIAKNISVDGRSKIVFYSRRVIRVDEELTYDYKFEFEDDDKKIPCLCRAATCRKYLN